MKEIKFKILKTFEVGKKNKEIYLSVKLSRKAKFEYFGNLGRKNYSKPFLVDM